MSLGPLPAFFLVCELGEILWLELALSSRKMFPTASRWLEIQPGSWPAIEVVNFLATIQSADVMDDLTPHRLFIVFSLPQQAGGETPCSSHDLLANPLDKMITAVRCEANS